MTFEIKQLSQAGNNVVAEIYCDGRIIAAVQCSPAERDELKRRLSFWDS